VAASSFWEIAIISEQYAKTVDGYQRFVLEGNGFRDKLETRHVP
jgi:hypothetical protein